MYLFVIVPFALMSLSELGNMRTFLSFYLITYIECFCIFLWVVQILYNREKFDRRISDLLAGYSVTLNTAIRWPCSCLMCSGTWLQWLCVFHSQASLLCLPRLSQPFAEESKHFLNAFFSSEPENYIVPELSRSCILRGWSLLLTQSTWPSCGLSTGQHPLPSGFCCRAVETPQGQLATSSIQIGTGGPWLFRFIERAEMCFCLLW